LSPRGEAIAESTPEQILLSQLKLIGVAESLTLLELTVEGYAKLRLDLQISKGLLDSPLEPVVQRFYLLEGNNCKCVEACHVVADVKLP
jgi:hypothetical protein